MDVNATLAEIRTLAALITDDQQACGDADLATRADAATELAERFAALDEWITRHGFLPTDWHAAQLRVIRGQAGR
jgi:hypothetical protein